MTRHMIMLSAAAALLFAAADAGARQPDQTPSGMPEGVLYYEAVGMMSSASAVNQAEDARTADTVELSFETFGRQFDLKLERHDPFAPGATVRWVGDNGVIVEPAAGGAYFRGQIDGDPNSWVRLTLRDGAMDGLMASGDEIYFLEPADRFFGAAAAGTTLAYRLSDTDADWIAGACAARAPSNLVRHRHAKVRGARLALHELLGNAAETLAASAGSLKQTDLGMVADYEYYSVHLDKSAADIAALVNSVDGIYEAEIGVTLRLLTTIVYTTVDDPFSSDTNANTLLPEFTTWKNAQDDNSSQPLWGTDLVHLMTGKNLDGNIIGIAYIGGVCTSSSAVGVDSDFTNDGAMLTLLLAHEMGHNFGAYHDNQQGSPCASSPGTYIMNPVIGGALQQKFSPCSHTYIDPLVASAGCLDTIVPGTPTNTPTLAPTPTPTLPPYGAAFLGQSVPTSMLAGQTYNVSVTMLNTGALTWTEAGSYRLGPWAATDWGVGRAYLDGNDSVGSGQQKTFSFTVRAPAAAGTYNFQWRMVRDGVAWFGSTSTNVVVTVTPNGPNASFIAQSVPTTMTAGQPYSVSVTMQNTGTTTWTAANSYRLGALSSSWGAMRIYLDGNDSIAPGQQKTFAWTVTAPTTPGIYGFQWKMVQEGVMWFGSPSTNVNVNVGGAAANAALMTQSVPTSMNAGQAYSVSVTMQNTGGTTWTAANGYRLGSQNPQGNFTWGMNRVYLGAGDSVAPGQQKVFTWMVTAPSTPGTYNFQWRMVQEGVAWFGALTTNVVVTVSGQPNAAFVGQTVPTSMTAGQAYSVSVTMQNTGGATWTAADSYRLGSQNPQGSFTWGMNRVYLDAGDSIAPGQQKTFTWNVTAPITPGSYNFQWKMLREGVAWFGGPSTNVAVNVVP